MVKNIASLVLFLIFTFIGILILATLLALLQDWTSSALLFPPDTVISGVFNGKIASYLASSLPAAFYLSVLLGLNYAVRRRIAYPVSFMLIWVFILILSGAAFMGLESLKRMDFSVSIKKPSRELAKPGLLLSKGTLNNNQWIFLGDPYRQDSARVVLSQSLEYQGQDAAPAPMPLPFFAKQNGIFDSIDRDFGHSSGIFSASFEDGLLFYGLYTGSLAAFLLSLGCLVNISFWSLANLFFGALAFRGALALENFLNQPHIHQLLSSFAGKVLNDSFINPVIFFTLSMMILLYSCLIYLSRGKISNG